MKFKLPLVGEIRFNPIASFLAILVIWGFVIWCSIAGEDVPFNDWTTWIVDNFTWLYIGSTDVWIVFGIILYFRLVIILLTQEVKFTRYYNNINDNLFCAASILKSNLVNLTKNPSIMM